MTSLHVGEYVDPHDRRLPAAGEHVHRHHVPQHVQVAHHDLAERAHVDGKRVAIPGEAGYSVDMVDVTQEITAERATLASAAHLAHYSISCATSNISTL